MRYYAIDNNGVVTTGKCEVSESLPPKALEISFSQYLSMNLATGDKQKLLKAQREEFLKKNNK